MFIFVQLLLTFDPVLVEKVATLAYHVMQDNPALPRLYLNGIFFFIMMYTGSNVLPIARFLKYTHLRQAFRSDEVRLIYQPYFIYYFLSFYFVIQQLFNYYFFNFFFTKLT